MNNLALVQWVSPLAYLLGSFVAGIILKRIVLARIKRFVGTTSWVGDDIIVGAFGKFSIPLFVVAGFYLALLQLPVDLKLTPLLQKTLVVSAIFIATLAVAKITVGLVEVCSRRGKGVLPSTSIFTNLARVAVLTIGFLVILQSLGITITPILTALGVGGLAVALALQETLANLFAGLHILISRQVRPGDYIQLDSGEAGYVTDINWRNTTIRALPNNMIIVPNAKLASTIITNFNQPQQELSFLVEVGVGYESDLKQVEQVTIEVAKELLKEVQGGVPTFEPFIRYHTFADSSINFTVILRAGEFADQYLLKHEFIKRLHERFRKEKIEIPFPIRTVHMKQT